ncbi:MAG: hypothetical protein QHH19_02005 [Candidatus Thermoplasmatota archaeon]|jgi:hypothetical protein|nr:hypothetical protein [Candidatus Thermoplasmatota archaeon]
METGSFKNGIQAWINRVVDGHIESINNHITKEGYYAKHLSTTSPFKLIGRLL